ncbi:alpha/beta fold hydrolase [Dactylosporangium darangshiense]|uniref:3-oxoadipate enol-lactonase n=1 Tax=Dactylosporangium darangshiense TaxID=579108 RepID=A0ABP8DCM5_9ACTN
MAPGVDLAVHDVPGSGPAVVLLHGLASTHRWWDLVADRLPGRRVVRIDHRGHGQSSTPPGGYTIQTLAADTAAVLGTLQLRRSVVAGHSLGATVALHLAVHRPDLVDGLCLVDGGIYDPRILFGASWWDAQYAMRLDRRIAPTPAMLTAWAHGRGLPDDAVPSLLANYQPTPANGGTGSGPVRLRLAVEHEIQLAHSLWRADPAALLARISVPTVAVLAHPRDPVAAATQQRALRHTLDQARRPVTTRWVDGSHDLPLEQPDHVGTAIADLADGAET